MTASRIRAKIVAERTAWIRTVAGLYWFQLQEGDYVAQGPDREGMLQSRIFPGLRLHLGSLLDGHLSRVLDELRKGLGTADHAAFVTRVSTR